MELDLREILQHIGLLLGQKKENDCLDVSISRRIFNKEYSGNGL
jgi:hypothetical protein